MRRQLACSIRLRTWRCSKACVCVCVTALTVTSLLSKAYVCVWSEMVCSQVRASSAECQASSAVSIECCECRVSCCSYRELLRRRTSASDAWRKRGRCDRFNQAPLLVAVERGHAKVVAHLLLHSADVHCAKRNGYTSLHIAAAEGHLGIIRMLLVCGANVDAQANDGSAPLQAAAKSGLHCAVTMPLGRGASVEPLLSSS